jgi:Ser/Thr protein kinase RdoA (MazF antagonist)
VDDPARTVRLVLVDASGGVRGALAPFDVETPWWQDVAPVVAGAAEHHGLDVTVLRLLEADRPEPPGGAVTYLAEADGAEAAAVVPWDGALDDDERRPAYARPGGARADVAWADAALERLGTPRDGPAEQVRTWNLSSLWRLPTRRGAAWLKAVPPFFAHEGALLERLQGHPVPRLLAREGSRTLLDEVPGDDLYAADVSQLPAMVDALVAIQRAWTGRTEELLALGVADWRAAALGHAIADVVGRAAGALPPEDRSELATFVSTLPQRFAELEACGLPDVLVHGDFHPGNFRGDGRRLVLLDWGDAGVGHPLLDLAAFLGELDPTPRAFVLRHWDGAWARVAPEADVRRAATLLAPVAAAREAVVYRRFLDAIEPSEHPYHRSDVAKQLSAAAAIVREE